jgi:hypothetical protein
VTHDIHARRSKYKMAFIVEIKEWYKHIIPNGSAPPENLK